MLPPFLVPVKESVFPRHQTINPRPIFLPTHLTWNEAPVTAVCCHWLQKITAAKNRFLLNSNKRWRERAVMLQWEEGEHEVQRLSVLGFEMSFKKPFLVLTHNLSARVRAYLLTLSEYHHVRMAAQESHWLH